MISYSKTSDANGERERRASEVASSAAKSVELASLQTARSLTYLTLHSSLVAVGLWSRLAAALNIRLLEREIQIGERLADILSNGRPRPSYQRVEEPTRKSKLGEAVKEPATAAGDAIQELARKAADTAASIAARMDDATTDIAAGADVARTSSADQGEGETADREIQLRAERLVINKQGRQIGDARVRKQIVTEVKSIDVPVTHEELIIERQAFSGDADVDGDPIADETIRIPLTEERVNIAKETVVNEEVEIGKRRVDDVEHVSDTVRHEEFVVLDGATTS